jgi:hypothetical protein
MPTSRFQGGRFEMSLPEIRTRPVSAWLKPAISRSSVVFPQPEGPRKAKNSPGWMARLTSFRTWFVAVGQVDALDVDGDAPAWKVERWRSWSVAHSLGLLAAFDDEMREEGAERHEQDRDDAERRARPPPAADCMKT